LLNTSGDIDRIENNNPGSKILEYVGARRPILALGSPENAVAPLMDRDGLGIYASSEEECTRALRTLYENFQAGKFESTLRPDWRPFTPRDLAERFAAVLDRITSGR
jgi:hypothetical protein